MLNEQQVRDLLGELQDPFLHKSLAETKGVTNVSIKAEKEHVSVRIAIAKTNTPEQMQLQMKVVEVLKENGAASVSRAYAFSNFSIYFRATALIMQLRGS